MSDTTTPMNGLGYGTLPPWSAWQEVAALAMLGMEMCGVALWLRIITLSGAYVSFWRAWAGLIIVVCVTYLINQLMVTWHLKTNIRRFVIFIWLLASLYIGALVFLDLGNARGLAPVGNRIVTAFNQVGMAYPSEFLLIVGIGWVVWRGVSLAEHSFEYSIARDRFVMGIIWMAAYCLLSPLTGESPIGAIYVFIGFGLLALSTARIYSFQFLRASRLIPFSRGWLLGIILSVLGIVGLGVVLSLVMEWKGAGLLVSLLIGALRLIFIVGSVIFLPVLVVFLEIAPFLARLLEQFPAIANQIMGILAAIQGAIERLVSRIGSELGVHVTISRPVLLWGIIIVGLILLMVTFSARVIKRRGLNLFETEQLEESDVLLSLRKSLMAIRKRLGFNPRDGSVARLLAEARIRKIYYLLMAMCSGLGLPRQAAQTPLEFMPAMQSLLPMCRDDLEVLTRAYLLVRYGELPESEQELIGVESAWKRVAEAGRQMKQQQSKVKGTA